ncbi:helix-turn-helix domain-containing protein [Kitasatospora acidiphila]|uniref:Helix-turn-helix domain-containing protein n=1 Tax=Kitasatospora acidiphila TaxID=2567942 RepID=A0A540VZL6_9ACTN|nr:IclR family transcriptional regulator C-terminal domain-containing protein [Kitasatospora acidiphila]TQF02216.1 helix-turn-helix domain-containing protein [Kitasatospora acidiphila]
MPVNGQSGQIALDQGAAGPQGAVRGALRLLEAVDRHPYGATLRDLARETAMSEPAVRELVNLLSAEGYLQSVDGAWLLGGTFAMLGQSNREQLVRIRLQHKLTELRDELGAAVYFSRYHDGELRVEAVAEGEHAPAVHEWVDFKATAHASAIGKCLLSQLDHDGRLDHLSRHPIARLTSRTITDSEQLLHRLERQSGGTPMLDLQEYALGTVCAAVPVTAGSTVGCLAMSLPVSSAHRLRAAAELLAERAAPLMLAMAV